jgi:glutamate racemase
MIGLFDSGSGGLTVLAALRARAPHADIVYFGDIANAPYGERSAEELSRLTEHGLMRLSDMGATEIVSACNSVSLSVLTGAAGHANVIEMTRPTARALRAHAGARILLIATPATIRSGIYRDAIGVSVLLEELSIPELAGAIEFGSAKKEVQRIIGDAFLEQKGKKYDGVILGCTHYPFVREEIAEAAREMFGATLIIDPAEAVAEEVVRRFNVEGSGAIRLLISKDSSLFRSRVRELFPESSYTIDTV